MKRAGVGIYGVNGHQIHGLLLGHPDAEAVAYAGVPADKLPEELCSATRCESLDELLSDGRVSVVSLCSPRRDMQAQDVLKCLNAGRHVYAEKPCAMTVDELDAIVATAKERRLVFHEMAGTVVQQPYREMRRLVLAGAIGEVVQVVSQKSYPFHENRPQDEGIDGGLLLQVGVYNLRFVEHVACRKVKALQVVETQLGNPIPDGQCRRAVGMQMTLEDGGLSSGVANYFCPPPGVHGRWGYENLRIFGTEGYIESIDMGRETRLQRIDKDCGPLDLSAPSLDYFELFLRELRGVGKSPLSLEDELRPTRLLLEARGRLRSVRPF
jgi:predicted dehydrogenase